MGEARRRGTREQRMKQAIERIEKMKPESLTCNNCQEKITEISRMDTRGMKGLKAGFAGICPKCNESTFALMGDEDAIMDAADCLAEAMGSEPKVGIEIAPNLKPEH